MKSGKLFWACCVVVVAFAAFQIIEAHVPAHFVSPGQALEVGLIHFGRVITEVLAPVAAVGIIIATVKKKRGSVRSVPSTG